MEEQTTQSLETFEDFNQNSAGIHPGKIDATVSSSNGILAYADHAVDEGADIPDLLGSEKQISETSSTTDMTTSTSQDTGFGSGSVSEISSPVETNYITENIANKPESEQLVLEKVADKQENNQPLLESVASKPENEQQLLESVASKPENEQQLLESVASKPESEHYDNTLSDRTNENDEKTSNSKMRDENVVTTAFIEAEDEHIEKVTSNNDKDGNDENSAQKVTIGKNFENAALKEIVDNKFEDSAHKEMIDESYENTTDTEKLDDNSELSAHDKPDDENVKIAGNYKVEDKNVEIAAHGKSDNEDIEIAAPDKAGNENIETQTNDSAEENAACKNIEIEIARETENIMNAEQKQSHDDNVRSLACKQSVIEHVETAETDNEEVESVENAGNKETKVENVENDQIDIKNVDNAASNKEEAKNVCIEKAPDCIAVNNSFTNVKQKQIDNDSVVGSADTQNKDKADQETADGSAHQNVKKGSNEADNENDNKAKDNAEFENCEKMLNKQGVNDTIEDVTSKENNNDGVSDEDSENTTSSAPVNESIEKAANDNAEDEMKINDTTKDEQATGVEEKENVMDILGNGLLTKKVLVPGKGAHTRPNNGDIVTLKVEGQLPDGTKVDTGEIAFSLNDGDVILAFELAAALMEEGEKCELFTSERYAYGSLGRDPDIPKDTPITYILELVNVQKSPDVSEISFEERLKMGEAKRERGNYLFGRLDYSGAINSYNKAVKLLDNPELNEGIDEGSCALLTESWVKCYNNLAACQLKITALDAAIKSCEKVLSAQKDNVKALFRLGKAYGAKGEVDQAITYIRRAIRLDPESKLMQQEMLNLTRLKNKETATEKALYQRMLGVKPGEKSSALNEERKKGNSNKLVKWTLVAGGIAAVLISVGLTWYRSS